MPRIRKLYSMLTLKLRVRSFTKVTEKTAHYFFVFRVPHAFFSLELCFLESSSKPKAKLFDGGESSDEEDETSEQDAFKIRSQFHGKSGEKNLSLQARFASDSRLDELVLSLIHI